MSVISINLAELVIPSWHAQQDGPQVRVRVAASIRRYGQVAPLLVWRENERYHVLDDPIRATVMRDMGLQEAWAWNLGDMGTEDAMELALSMLLRPEPDYARVARLMAAMPQDVCHRLPDVTPFDAERVSYFRTLVDFDWGQFSSSPDGQIAMEWGGSAEILPEALVAPVEQAAAPEAIQAQEPSVNPPGGPEPAQEELLGQVNLF